MWLLLKIVGAVLVIGFALLFAFCAWHFTSSTNGWIVAAVKRSTSAKFCVVAAFAFIAGCAAPTAAPYAVEITDAKQYTADLAACATYALGYKPRFDFGSVTEGFAKGAAGNAGGAAVNPWVPVIAGAGQATSAVINGVDLMSAGQRAVFLKCTDKKTERDQSALVLEPNM